MHQRPSRYLETRLHHILPADWALVENFVVVLKAVPLHIEPLLEAPLMELMALQKIALKEQLIVVLRKQLALLVKEVVRYVTLVDQFVGSPTQGLDDCLTNPHLIDTDRTRQVLHLLILRQELLVVLLRHLDIIRVVNWLLLLNKIFGSLM